MADAVIVGVHRVFPLRCSQLIKSRKVSIKQKLVLLLIVCVDAACNHHLVFSCFPSIVPQWHNQVAKSENGSNRGTILQ